ncbi:MAG: radical SAM protein [Defluviitaleaceae bacterium]|nr:radical SAM protein [Defluviitaleaceae bacterium]MCL2274410.1 radical SAM protein [Defluviitaleaceae bacterium]
MNYQNCVSLARNHMMFNSNMEAEIHRISYCCTDEAKNIQIILCDDPEETLSNYYARKKEILDESKRLAQSTGQSDNPYYLACTRCPVFECKDWGEESDLIHFICFNATPAPCQAKCFYCSQNLENRRKYDKEKDAPGYDLIFKHIEYFRDKGLFAENIHWDISAGEITIHPLKEKLYELVGNASAAWLTNCYVYSEQIGNNLANSKRSYILFSMDSGTPKTWQKIKGSDNFEAVKETVRKYKAVASNPSQQIILKYIILPGINDDIKNISKFITFVGESGFKRIVVARDRWSKNPKENVEGASTILAFCAISGIVPDFNFFHPQEMEEIKEIAKRKANSLMQSMNGKAVN